MYGLSGYVSICPPFRGQIEVSFLLVLSPVSHCCSTNCFVNFDDQGQCHPLAGETTLSKIDMLFPVCSVLFLGCIETTRVPGLPSLHRIARSTHPNTESGAKVYLNTKKVPMAHPILIGFQTVAHNPQQKVPTHHSTVPCFFCCCCMAAVSGTVLSLQSWCLKFHLWDFPHNYLISSCGHPCMRHY